MGGHQAAQRIYYTKSKREMSTENVRLARKSVFYTITFS